MDLLTMSKEKLNRLEVQVEIFDTMQKLSPKPSYRV